MSLSTAPGVCRPTQRGLALTETSAALALAALLLLACYAGAQHAKRVYLDASALAELQDRERTAMSLIAHAVESSGDSPALAAAATRPAGGALARTGPGLSAASGGAPASDSLTARVPAAILEAIGGCTTGERGRSSVGDTTLTFSIDASLGLVCSSNGAAPAPLVAGVDGMTLLFGVHANDAVVDGAFDSYLTAAQMTPADWQRVVVVNVTLTFRNPLFGRAGQPPTIPFQRTVAVMAHAGVQS